MKKIGFLPLHLKVKAIVAVSHPNKILEIERKRNLFTKSILESENFHESDTWNVIVLFARS